MYKKWMSSVIVFALAISQMSNISAAGMPKNSGGSKDSQQEKVEKEKQELLAEAAGYHDQFIVRFSDSDPDASEMEGHAQAAFAQAYHQKAAQAEAVSAEIEDESEQQEFARALDMGVSAVAEAKTEGVEMEQAFGGYEVIKLPEKVSPDVFVEEFLQETGDAVAYIQPDYIVILASETGEGDLGQEQGSGLEEMDSTQESDVEQEEEKSEMPSAPQGNILEREADLQEAWKHSDGAGITVALLDTGVDTSHPDLAGHMLTGYDFINGREEVYDAGLGMEQAHGTHMAGIIAQSAPGAQILPLKVFEYGNAYTSDILDAIAFAQEQGASVVNMSFGCTDNNQALRQAMEESEMFFVCAAGNHRKDLGETPIYPAAFDLENSISVAALNQDLGIAYFSNYGEEADIAAWGRDVYSTFPGGEHGEMDGTSMAAGYVSAAAAIAASSGVETDGLKGRLKETADRISCLDGKVSDGNKLSFSGAAYGVVKEGVAEVAPKEDLDETYELMSPKEKLELFSAKKNIAVAASGMQGVALKEDGTVWVWGYMLTGTPLDENVTSSYEPVKMPGLEDIVAISGGNRHCLALTRDGKVYAWGLNSDGQLGNGTTNNSRLPVRATTYSAIKSISAGRNHSLAVSESGGIYAWGGNSCGQLGDASQSTKWQPLPNPFLNDEIVEVSAGYEDSMALTKGGEVLVWGRNVPEDSNMGTTNRMPSPMNFEHKVKKFSTAYYGIMKYMITEGDGAIWGWKVSWDGYEGTGDTISSLWDVHLITGPNENDLKGMVDISSGFGSTLALRQDGTVWGWGLNANGELGIGSTSSVSVPTMMHRDVKAVAVGESFSLMLKNDGTIVAAGSNNSGECGQKKYIKECLYPTEVAVGENLSFNTAHAMTLDETINGELANNNQCRYYSFVPSKTGFYSFEGITNYDFYGALYNEEKERIAFNDNGNGAGESTNKLDFYIQHKLSAGKTYYLMVCSQGANYSGPFAVKVKYVDDYVNVIEGAEEILLGEDKTCNIDYGGDIDVFCFVPKRTAIYTFETVSDFDTYGKLYNAAGTEIAYNDDGKLQGESTNRLDFYIKHSLVANQTYYIAVKAYSASKTGSLVLKVKESQDDYGNQIASAFNITDQYKTEGVINYIGDKDVFAFTSHESGTYIFSTAGNVNLDGTLHINVIGAPEMLVAIPTYVGNNIKFQVALKANETCYLLLHNKDTSISSLGAYQVYVETPLTVTVE